jgi:cell division protein FtsB
VVRTAWVSLVATVALAVLVIGVFPVRTWLAQRDQTARAEQRLAALQAANDALEQRLAALDSDAEIERLAREQYGLVVPGGAAYAVLPAPFPQLPETWPYPVARRYLEARLAASPPPTGAP